MFVPMWLIVLLIVLSSFSIWAFIFVSGFLVKVFDSIMKQPKKPQTPEAGEQK